MPPLVQISLSENARNKKHPLILINTIYNVHKPGNEYCVKWGWRRKVWRERCSSNPTEEEQQNNSIYILFIYCISSIQYCEVLICTEASSWFCLWYKVCICTRKTPIIRKTKCQNKILSFIYSTINTVIFFLPHPLCVFLCHKQAIFCSYHNQYQSGYVVILLLHRCIIFLFCRVHSAVQVQVTEEEIHVSMMKANWEKSSPRLLQNKLRNFSLL